MVPENRKGLTLVELLIAMAIMGIIMAPISLVFYSGYSNYYYQNDDMNNIQKSREIIDKIMEDLRANDSSAIAVMDEGNTLYIKEDLIYTYLPGNKKLLKNGVPLFNDSDQVSINDFKVEEIKPSDYDSNLINITIKIKSRKSEEVTIQNSYRRKIG